MRSAVGRTGGATPWLAGKLDFVAEDIPLLTATGRQVYLLEPRGFAFWQKNP
jgi:hypothetical protein